MLRRVRKSHEQGWLPAAICCRAPAAWHKKFKVGESALGTGGQESTNQERRNRNMSNKERQDDILSCFGVKQIVRQNERRGLMQLKIYPNGE
eukprot:scaffold163061_cov12-Tisochrysis_lutea.AAC.1